MFKKHMRVSEFALTWSWSLAPGSGLKLPVDQIHINT